MSKLEALRAQGVLPPLVQYIEMSRVYKGKDGHYHWANDEYLHEQQKVQQRASIDSFGNLVVDGEIVHHRWLQSFEQ